MKRSPQHNARIGRAVARHVIATHPETGAELGFQSVKLAAQWASVTPSGGNISKAIQSSKTAYGFYWRKA